MSNVLLKTEVSSGTVSVTYFLHPGKLFASARGHRVTTILGSCVAVCLFDAEHVIGGVNHFVLPTANGHPRLDGLRFGDMAVPALVRAVRRHGAQPRTLVAKLFGGAALTDASDQLTIGLNNVAAARSLLAAHGIPVVAEDVGGHVGRKLIFDTATGTALVKRL